MPHTSRPFIGRRPRALLFCVAAVVAALGARVPAQDLWYKSYLDGKSAYEKGDLGTAERKIKAAMDAKDAPKERGQTVPLVSQQRGFLPEYYLALICASEKRWTEALTYAQKAQTYVKRSDKEWSLLSGVLLDAPAAVAAAAPPAASPPPAPTQPPASPDTSAKSSAPGAQVTFDKLMGNARAALTAGRLDEARSLVAQAQTLNFDAAAAGNLGKQIDAQEFAAVMTEARKAVGEKRYAAGRTSAQRARALGIDNAQADALLGDITRQENFSSALVEAQKALTERRWTAARDAAARARSFNVDNQQADDVSRSADVADLSDQVNALVASRSFAQVAPILDRLATLDPGNALVARTRPLVNASLADSDKERLGMGAFYRGQYRAAIDTLQQLAGSGRVRAKLYIASSRAALSLVELDASAKTALEQQARQDFESIRGDQATFAADLPYLSPSIKKVLGIS